MAKNPLKSSSVYSGCCMVLTTKHAKSIAIAPIFWQTLRASVIEYVVDTDQLGTFSGETARKGTALECARQKCEWSLANLGDSVDFALASEGSFGPHPFIPFTPCDHEILYFIDRQRNFHLHLAHLSEKTNYRRESVDSLSALQQFAQATLFPSHALIVRPDHKQANTPVFKGLTCETELSKAFTAAQKHSLTGRVWVETDMRAQFNPLRMQVISELAQQLADRLTRHCPQCNTPGWGTVAYHKGLRCQCCHQQTEMISHELFGCVSCEHQQVHPRSDGLTTAPPMHCAWCNP